MGAWPVCHGKMGMGAGTCLEDGQVSGVVDNVLLTCLILNTAVKERIILYLL